MVELCVRLIRLSGQSGPQPGVPPPRLPPPRSPRRVIIASHEPEHHDISSIHYQLAVYILHLIGHQASNALTSAVLRSGDKLRKG